MLDITQGVSLLSDFRPWLAALIAYFCGCFNGAVIVSKYILRDDVRTHGSGNAGLTNFQRTFGGGLTAVVILCDVLKAVVAILVAVALGNSMVSSCDLPLDQAQVVTLFKYWAALFCLLGHMFPCMFHFKGGKGILSGGTIVFMIDWRIALVVWGGFLILAVLTRYVSLGSCWAGGSFPFATWFVYHNVLLTLLGVIIGGLILYKHRGNIQRLLSGTESKFTFKKK
jgi:glycerol-3-phosphate acyltransferase PlsY